MKRPLTQSFNDAISGVVSGLASQRNMKIHFVMATGTLLAAAYFGLPRMEMMVISLAIALVMAMELMNTAIESVVDLETQKYHPLAKKAKDLAAGAVLVAAINAVLVGYLIFSPYLHQFPFRSIRSVILDAPMHLAVTGQALILLLVLGMKAWVGKGYPLYGGWPSGHSALASGLWTTLLLVSPDAFSLLIGLAIVLLVIHSRVERQIHIWPEVLAGALIGNMVVILLFRILEFGP